MAIYDGPALLPTQCLGDLANASPGKVLNQLGTPDAMLMAYTVRGDSVYIAPPGVDAANALVLGIKPGGILDAGAVGSLKKQ